MKKSEFALAIRQICDEKGIPEEAVISTIEAAIASAYRKDFAGPDQKIKAKFNVETGSTEVYRVWDVASEVEDPEKEISLKNAKKKRKNTKVGDEITQKLEAPQEYGRIAAQTAKQVVIQRIREAERNVIYNEFKKKESELLNASVQQIEGRNVIVDLGRTTGILFPSEQIPNEHYYIGQRLKVYVVSVEETSKAPLISVSRAHPELIHRLFELEVPEINAGSVEIMGIAREAGRRTKMAVAGHQEGVDPVGSCVGQRGTRVQAVLAEVGDEKIDIISYNEDPAKYIEAALSPAKVVEVKLDKKNKKARVLVEQDQLSLAIGKEGQNVRLASKLSGWELDVEKVEEKDEKKTKEIPRSKEALETKTGKTLKKKATKAKTKKAVKEKKPEKEKSKLDEKPKKTAENEAKPQK